MQDFAVEPNSFVKLGRVDGELKVGKNARIEAVEGKIVVAGGVYFEGGAEVSGSLECSRLKAEHTALGIKGVKIDGDLTVQNELGVVHSLQVAGNIKAGSIDVEGEIRAKSVSAKNIRANGVMEVETTIESEESTEITGKLNAPGEVKLHDFGITGQAKVGGGKILGHAQVRGKFETSSKIDFGELHVFGSATLPSNCTGRKLSTFGKLIVRGGLTCDEIEVQGTTTVRGKCDSRKTWVRGKLNITGSLSASEILETFGTTEVSGNFTGGSLHVGGKLEAGQVILTGDVDIAGRVETKQGLKANKVKVRSGSRCESPIVAETVEVGGSYMNVGAWQTEWMGQEISMRLIGKETKVQDIYAKNVHLGVASSARKIFAQNVQVERSCVVDKIVYAGELELPEGSKSAYINHPPEKVENLPTPPF